MTDEGWSLADHACRFCTGRLLHRGDVYRCAGCEAESKGTPDGICGCGMRTEGAVQRSAGFRCVPNPDRGPASRVAIVIAFDGGADGKRDPAAEAQKRIVDAGVLAAALEGAEAAAARLVGEKPKVKPPGAGNRKQRRISNKLARLAVKRESKGEP